jgi:hypothetical protein
VTEAEWLACEDPQRMLTLLQERRAGDRKLRLVVGATYRRVLEVYVSTHWRNIVGLVERWVDGEAPAADVARAAEPYHAICNYSQDETEIYLASAVVHMTGTGEGFRPGDAVACCRIAYGNIRAGYGAAWNPPLQEQFWREIDAEARAAVRDIFGDPFRPVAFSPDWRTDTALALARQLYESRDFSPMPILADALQDAGCGNEDILNHCRSSGPHVRGCWVVDLVLGKE